MIGDNNTNRNLWIITGLASIPFAILAFVDPAKVKFPHIYILFVGACLFNGLVVPFVLFKNEPDWIQKTLALGVNMIFATLWIDYTGGTSSIFYPNFYLLPIIAATMYCGFIDSFLTAFFAGLLSLWFQYNELGLNLAIIGETSILVNIIFFFLLSSILGYLIKIGREQQASTMKITSELETAYHQLSASHEQLQSYTEIIEKMNKEMEQLAITDELTGLYNYRYFQIALDKELKKNKFSVVSLFMLDIDNFKLFNDRHGHLMGNRMLAEIARVIKENVRGVDTAVRYGGEEFAVIFPGMDSNEVAQLAERIREIVENTYIKTGAGEPVSVTVSIGVASYPRDAQTKSELISHADLALYDAKQAGRNQVCIFKKKPALES